MTRIMTVIAGLLLVAATASAQPNIRNAKIETRSGANLAATFESLSTAAAAEPVWIGYAVAAQDPEWNACCYRDGNECCGRCELEEGRRSGGDSTTVGARRGPIALEGT